MNTLQAIEQRRSIRRYRTDQIDRDTLTKILTAATYAPNAGGGQRSRIVAVRNAEDVERLGRVNRATFKATNLAGSYVSADQPSIIDDPSIKSAFYGAPCVAVIFSPTTFLYGEADAYTVANTMTLAAHELGVSSCIIARAEDTFATEYGRKMQQAWGVPNTYTARCFVALGYHDGDYPAPKPRKDGRIIVIE